MESNTPPDIEMSSEEKTEQILCFIKDFLEKDFYSQGNRNCASLIMAIENVNISSLQEKSSILEKLLRFFIDQQNICESSELEELKEYLMDLLIVYEEDSQIAGRILHYSAKTMLDIAISSNFGPDVRVQILKFFNNFFSSSDKALRKRVSEGLLEYLPGLVHYLNMCGDFLTQVSVLETIFRICNCLNLETLSRKIFPDQSLRSIFVKLKDFDPAARVLLNLLNGTMGARCLVHSLPALTCTVGDIQIFNPPEYSHFWVDFSLRSSVLSINYVREKEGSNLQWECLALEKQSVIKVTVCKKGPGITLRIEVDDLNCMIQDARSDTILLVLQENSILEKILRALYPGKLLFNGEERRAVLDTGGVYVTAGLIKTPQKSQMALRVQPREISPVKCVADTSDDSDGLPCAQKKTCSSSSNESSLPNARSVIPAAESVGNAKNLSVLSSRETDVSKASSFKIPNPPVVAQQEVEAVPKGRGSKCSFLSLNSGPVYPPTSSPMVVKVSTIRTVPVFPEGSSPIPSSTQPNLSSPSLHTRERKTAGFASGIILTPKPNPWEKGFDERKDKTKAMKEVKSKYQVLPGELNSGKKMSEVISSSVDKRSNGKVSSINMNSEPRSFPAVREANTSVGDRAFPAEINTGETSLPAQKIKGARSLSAEKNTGARTLSAEKNTVARSLSGEKNTGARYLSAEKNTGARSFSAEKNTGSRSLSAAKDTRARALSAEKNAGARSLSAEKNTRARALSAEKNAGARSLSVEKNKGVRALSAEKDTGARAFSAEKNTGARALSAEKNKGARSLSAVKNKGAKALSAEKNKGATSLSAEKKTEARALPSEKNTGASASPSKKNSEPKNVSSLSPEKSVDASLSVNKSGETACKPKNSGLLTLPDERNVDGRSLIVDSLLDTRDLPENLGARPKQSLLQASVMDLGFKPSGKKNNKRTVQEKVMKSRKKKLIEPTQPLGEMTSPSPSGDFNLANNPFIKASKLTKSGGRIRATRFARRVGKMKCLSFKRILDFNSLPTLDLEEESRNTCSPDIFNETPVKDRYRRTTPSSRTRAVRRKRRTWTPVCSTETLSFDGEEPRGFNQSVSRFIDNTSFLHNGGLEISLSESQGHSSRNKKSSLECVQKTLNFEDEEEFKVLEDSQSCIEEKDEVEEYEAGDLVKSHSEDSKKGKKKTGKTPVWLRKTLNFEDEEEFKVLEDSQSCIEEKDEAGDLVISQSEDSRKGKKRTGKTPVGLKKTLNFDEDFEMEDESMNSYNSIALADLSYNESEESKESASFQTNHVKLDKGAAFSTHSTVMEESHPILEQDKSKTKKKKEEISGLYSGTQDQHHLHPQLIQDDEKGLGSDLVEEGDEDLMVNQKIKENDQLFPEEIFDKDPKDFSVTEPGDVLTEPNDVLEEIKSYSQFGTKKNKNEEEDRTKQDTTRKGLRNKIESKEDRKLDQKKKKAELLLKDWGFDESPHTETKKTAGTEFQYNKKTDPTIPTAESLVETVLHQTPSIRNSASSENIKVISREKKQKGTKKKPEPRGKKLFIQPRQNSFSKDIKARVKKQQKPAIQTEGKKTTNTKKCVYAIPTSPPPFKYQRLTYGRKPKKYHGGNIFSDDEDSPVDINEDLRFDWEVPKFRGKCQIRKKNEIKDGGKGRIVRKSLRNQSFHGDTEILRTSDPISDLAEISSLANIGSREDIIEQFSEEEVNTKLSEKKGKMRSKRQGSDLFSGSKITGDDLSSGSRIQEVNPSTDQSLPLFCLSTALQCARFAREHEKNSTSEELAPLWQELKHLSEQILT